MSVNTATAKRVSRTLRASPSKAASSSNAQTTREDIENLSAVMLASLGITPKSTSSSTSSTSTNASSGTPQNSERAIKRTFKGSIGPSDNSFATPMSGHTAGGGSKSRTVSSSSTLSTGVGADTSRSRDRTSSSDMLSPHQQAPLTAIRRPAQHSTSSSSSSNKTVSTPLSAKANPTISKSSASPARVGASTSNSVGVRSKRGSSALPTRDSGLSMSTSTRVDARDRKSSNTMNTKNRVSDIMSQTPLHLAVQDADVEEDDDQRRAETGVYVSQEEYTSLVALLSAKDEQINALTAQVEEAKKENANLSTRNAQVQKEKDALVAERKSAAAAAAGKVQSGSAASGIGAGTAGQVSRAEMDAFKKQYEMQENLLEGFQRENEKATLEIDGLKKREKHLTEHLKKIYGPAFSAEHDLAPLAPDSQAITGKRFPGNNAYNTSITGPGSPLGGGISGLNNPLRRTSGGFQALPLAVGNNGYNSGTARSSPLTQESGSSESSLAEMTDEDHINPDDAASASQTQTKLPHVEPAVLMDQLLSVQSLLQRFEKRLLVRESELLKKEKEAEGQLSKLEGMKEQLMA